MAPGRRTQDLDLLSGPPPDDPQAVERLEQVLLQSEVLWVEFGDDAAARRLAPEMGRRLRALGYIR